MKTWQYELVQMQPGQGLKALLKTLGEEGWEAWHFDNERKVVFVKREPEKIVIASSIQAPL